MLYDTEEVSGNSPYADLKIGDQENGYSFGFVFLTRDSAVSPEYGKFAIWQGLQFDEKAETEEALIASLKLASFIPNTMLQNFEKNGAFSYETAYILTKKWTKGDKYNGNLRAKGHGWEVKKIKIPTSVMDKIVAHHNSLMSVVETTDTDTAGAEAQGEEPKAQSGVKM